MLNELTLTGESLRELEESFKKFENLTFFEIENEKKLLTEIINVTPYVFNLIEEELKTKKDYLILRKFGKNLSTLVSLVYFLSRGKIFHIPRLNNAFIAIFEMKNSNELSHTLKDGFFHTDYSTHPYTPDYLTLNIVRRDPMYPFYSRNSIVLLNDIIDFLKLYNRDLLKYLTSTDVPIKVNDKIVYQKIINLEDNVIRFHEKLIKDALIITNRENEVYYIDEFVTICTSLMKDFVLDEGDLAIISNKTVLHKRGPATVKFDNIEKKFIGRKVYSIRFYK